MISRAGSDISCRRQRAKSSPSVKKIRTPPVPQESPDADATHVQALTAAHIAMERARRASSEWRSAVERSSHDSGTSKIGTAATSRPNGVHFAAPDARAQRHAVHQQSKYLASTLQMPENTLHARFSDAAEPSISEFGAIGAYASEPSSYRRLRKAKSMLIPRKPATYTQDVTTRSPGSARTLRNLGNSVLDAEHGIKLGFKRSMSFLRGSTSNNMKKSKQQGSQSNQTDKAIELARDRFLNDVEQQQTLRQKPSFPFASRSKHSQKSFRKSVRSSGATDSADGNKSDNQFTDEFKPASRVRSISSSLRDKVKRAFGGSSSNGEGVPAQQLEASRPHFRDYVDVPDIDAAYEDYYAGETPSAYRGSLYIASNNGNEFLEDLDKLPDTLHAARDDASLNSNNRSRVTSWTNSTISNSLAMRGTALERKRLSIIQEHGGPHQPSSSAGRHENGITVFREPLTSCKHDGTPATPVDGQRIYSALMKRLDQEQAQFERRRDLATLAIAARDGQETSLSVVQETPTIRAVLTKAPSSDIGRDDQYEQASRPASSWHENTQIMTQQLAQHNENLEKRRLRLAEQEAQSSFFPFSSEIQPETPSPFRLALVARKENQQGSDDESTGSIVVRHKAKEADRGNDANSDSVYSQTSGGYTAGFNTRVDEMDDEPAASGMVTIVPTRVNRSPKSASLLLQLRQPSRKSSRELKAWMGSQITSLDRRKTRRQKAHTREYAQIDTHIDGEEGSFLGGQRSRLTTEEKPAHSTGVTKRASENTIRDNCISKSTSPVVVQVPPSLNERFPLLDLKVVPSHNTPLPKSSVRGVSAVEVNDENMRPDGNLQQQEALRVRLRGKPSHVSLDNKEGNAKLSVTVTPARSQVSAQQSKKAASFATLRELTPTPKRRVRKPPSQVTIRSQYGIITPGGGEVADQREERLSSKPQIDSENGVDPYHVIHPKQRLYKTEMANGSSPACLGDDEEEDTTTALPRTDEIQDRGERTAAAVAGLGGRRRMVSNFLRSRRRAATAAAAAAAQGSGAARSYSQGSGSGNGNYFFI